MTRSSLVEFDVTDALDDPNDRLILGILGALLLFNPFSMGAYQPWSELVSLLAIAVLNGLLAWRLITRRELRFVWSWAYLPIVLFMLWSLLQLVPLPAEWVKAISPHTVQEKNYLLADLPDAAQKLQRMSISFYHEQAWHDLRVLVGVIGVFVVTLNMTRGARPIKLVLWGIAIIGTAEALLGIAQNLTGATGVYWMIPLWGNMRPEAGSFANHNYFAQFVNLSSGAALGLLLMIYDQTFKRHDYTPAEVLEKLGSRDFRPVWILAAMLTINASSVFLSLSRGGMISLVLAAILLILFLAIRGGTRGMGPGGWGVAAIVVGVLAIITVSGKDLVEERIRKMTSVSDQYNRLQMTKDTLHMWQDYPVTGMGLGTFRFVFSMYDHTIYEAVATHAEDEYAQLLAETGVIGAGCAGLFLLIVGGCFSRAWMRGKKTESSGSSSSRRSGSSKAIAGEVIDLESSEERGEFDEPRGGRQRKRKRRSSHTASTASSLSLGLGFGLIAILVQSASDFSQHHLGMASLTAACCAIMINLAWLRKKERGQVIDLGPAQGKLIARATGLALVVVVFVPVLVQAFSSFTAQRYSWKLAEIGDRIAENNGEMKGDKEDIARWHAMQSQERPGDVLFHVGRDLARADLVLAKATDEKGIVTPNAQQRDELQSIVDSINDARWLCPTYGPGLSQIGQWECNYLNQVEKGERHITLAYELAPDDSSVGFVYGGVLGDHGKWKEAIALFQRLQVLNEGIKPDVIDAFLNYFHRPDLALQVAGDDLDDLHRLSAMLRQKGRDGPTTEPATQPADEEIALSADKHADEVTQHNAQDPNASAKTLADLAMQYEKKQEYERSLPYFYRAVALDYGNWEWHLAYARAFDALHRTDEAKRQLQIVLMLRPKQPDALEILDRLSASDQPGGEKAR